MPGQVDALASNIEGAAVQEGLFGCGSRGVIVTEQQLPRLLVPDADDVSSEQRRGAGVVGVVME